MKKKCLGLLRIVGLTALGFTNFLACDPAGETAFGKSCELDSDCISNFCVGGEAGPGRSPFCSDDCIRKKTGDACGEGQGKCIADFVSWCWLPCETDADCAAVSSERTLCRVTTENGVEVPFKICFGTPPS